MITKRECTDIGSILATQWGLGRDPTHPDQWTPEMVTVLSIAFNMTDVLASSNPRFSRSAFYRRVFGNDVEMATELPNSRELRDKLRASVDQAGRHRAAVGE